MDREEMKKKLLREINQLRAPQDYLYAGIPSYRGLVGRDALIVSWQLLRIFPEIARNTLEILAKFQGKKVDASREEEPGRILHEYYQPFSQGWLRKWRVRKDLGKFPHYGSIDSTLWFVVVSWFYYQATQDTDLIRKIWPNLERALEWIENYGDKDGDGFVEYQRMNHKGPRPEGWNPHQGWKECLPLGIKSPVAIVEVQGYTYLTYQALSRIALEVFGKKNLSRSLEEKAKRLKARFNQEFWMEEEKFCILGLDGNKQQISDISSNSGHLLFTGIVDDTKIPFVVERLFQDDLWTPFGIRTLSLDDPKFGVNPHLGDIWPHDNWIIQKGLQACGYSQEAQQIREALISAYDKLGYIPEFYGTRDGKIVKIPGSCCPQAWASAGLLEIITED